MSTPRNVYPLRQRKSRRLETLSLHLHCEIKIRQKSEPDGITRIKLGQNDQHFWNCYILTTISTSGIVQLIVSIGYILSIFCSCQNSETDEITTLKLRQNYMIICIISYIKFSLVFAKGDQVFFSLVLCLNLIFPKSL